MLIKLLINKYNNDPSMYNNIVGTILVKSFSLMLNIISISAYLHFFSGNFEIYGVWLTIVSILNWVLTFDLGIGNGLRNRLVRAISAGDTEEQRTLISSGYILLGIVAGVIALGFLIACRFVNWTSVLNISDPTVTQTTLEIAISISIIGLSLHFVLKLVVSILYSIKMTALGSFITLAINLSLVVFASLLSTTDPNQGLIQIAIFYALAMVVPLVLVNIIVFAGKFKDAKPSFRCYSHTSAVSVLSLGGQFFAVQILLLLINSTNEFIITRIDSPESVVTYNIYFRLFSAIIALFTVIANPVWSSIAECHSKGDYPGIVWRMKTIYRIGLAISLACILIIPFYRYLVSFLYPAANIEIDTITVTLFSISSCIMILINATSCVENGISCLRPQLIGCGIAAAMKIPLSLSIYIYVHNWVSVIVANIIVMGVSLAIQHAGLRREIARLAA